VVSTSKSIHELRLLLVCYQKRLRAGDRIPSITELANIAGVHRDTLYSLIDGKRISERSQYAISKSLATIAESAAGQGSKLLSVSLSTDGPSLYFGLANLNILSNR
jgi:hypothetical protein